MASLIERLVADPLAEMVTRSIRPGGLVAWGALALCIPACVAAAFACGGGVLSWLGVGGAAVLAVVPPVVAHVAAGACRGSLLWARLTAMAGQPLAFAAASVGWSLSLPGESHALALIATLSFTAALLLEHSTHRMAAKARGAYLHYYPPKRCRADAVWGRLGTLGGSARVPWAGPESFVLALTITLAGGSAVVGLAAGTLLSTLRWGLDLRIRIAELRQELSP